MGKTKNLQELIQIRNGGEPCWAVRVIFTGVQAKEAATLVKEEIDMMISSTGVHPDIDEMEVEINTDLHDCKDHPLRNPPLTLAFDEIVGRIESKYGGRPSAYEVNQEVVMYGATHGIDPINQAELRRQILQQLYGHRVSARS